jgi:hypothetical protein
MGETLAVEKGGMNACDGTSEHLPLQSVPLSLFYLRSQHIGYTDALNINSVTEYHSILHAHIATL